MRLALLIFAALVAATAAWGFHGEMHRQRHRAEASSGRLAAARRQLQAAEARLAEIESGATTGTQKQLKASAEQIEFLEAELHSERQRHDDVDTFLERTAKALRAERVRHSKEIWEARQFMPEGVRQAVVAVNECLRLEGQQGLRLLRARRLEDKVLYDVQLLDQDLGRLSTTLYIAGQVRFHLDRSTSNLALVFKDGFRRSPAERVEFPAEGEKLVLPGIDGPLWEKRLPFLIQAIGAYPVEARPVARPLMLAATRASWRKRINQLLQQCQTETRYRLERFRNLRDGQFRDVLLLGYSKGKVLVMSVEAERMAVWIDEAEQSVELQLQAGVARKSAGQTAIPKSGQRIRLSGLKPAMAIELMQGMVVRR